MSLCELWKQGVHLVAGKSLAQLAPFAGPISDGSPASDDFRNFLRLVPSSYLADYIDTCLSEKIEPLGFLLQDLVNEIGIRLGFEVTPGPYRGSSNRIGYDGIWKSADQSIVCEIKTSSHINIDIDVLANYRARLIEKGEISLEKSSILIVVGRFNTGSWESQIRGSRHAWDTRVISVDGLLKLLSTKEAVDDPAVFEKIISILTPHEFTKLDEIVDLVFSTAIESQEPEPGHSTVGAESGGTHASPQTFHSACVDRLSRHFETTLVRETRTGYTSSDGELKVQVAVSKLYDADTRPNYWFGLAPHQLRRLEKAKSSFIAWGCGSADLVFLVPFNQALDWLPSLNITPGENEPRHYHIIIRVKSGRWELETKGGLAAIDISRFRMP